MKTETKLELDKSFADSVRKCVAKGNHARWGEPESVRVIKDVVEAFVSSEDAMSEGVDALESYLAAVVNPSQFAQRLEKKDTSHPAHIRRPARGTGGSKAKVEV